MMRSTRGRGIAGAPVAILIGALVAFSAAAQTVPFATIAVGNGPESVVADRANGKVFVVNSGSNTVSVIDAATLAKVGDIPTGGGPRRLKLWDASNKLYVNNATDDSITVVDRASSAVVATIPLPAGSQPWDIGGLVDVVLRGTNQIALVDPSTDTVLTYLGTGASPRSVCMSPPSGNLYVTNFDSDSVSRVKMYGAGTPAVTEIPVGKGPGSCVGLQVGYPFENTAWMVIEASSGDATLSLINDSLGIVWETVPVDAGPVLLATNGIGPLDPQTFLLSNLSIVGHQGTGKVSLLLDGTLTPFITLPTGASPWAALIDPDYNALYVANRDANTVTVIDLYKFRVQQQVPVGARPQSLALDLRNVFVANQNGGASGSVSVIKRFNFRPAQDANGDGRSDILAQSAVSGELAMLYMNGVLPSEIQTDLFVKLAPGPWVSVLRGDFSGDRKDDLLLRHSVTKRLGFVYLFPTMAGTLVDAPITRVPLHAVDCLGTEVRCVLVRDSATGEVAYWSGYLGSPKEQVIYDRDPAWTPILVGDLDGDMRDDIVWRHTDGSVAAWLMTGTSTTPYDAIFGSKANKVLLAPGTAWVPEHLGDFDGDGRADVLWRNTTTGETAIWLMNGLDAKSYASVHPGTAGWRVTNVRDLDGDQKDDLVWRSAAGETAAWLMDGLAANSGRMSVLLDDPNWRVTHTQFTAVSPRSSLVWRNDVTGETAVWTMNGLMPQSAAYISHDPDWVVVPPE